MRRVPDMQDRDRLRHDMDRATLPTPRGQCLLPALPALPAVNQGQLTEEQRAVQAAMDYARKLDIPQAMLAVSAMTAFRRCYVVAYRELQKQLGTLPDAPPLLEDCLVGAAMYAAAKSFSEHDLMTSLLQSVLPWLGAVVDEHTKDEEATRAKVAQEADDLRRNLALPLCFRHSDGLEHPVLTRDRVLVLTGPRAALHWLVDQVLELVLAAKESFRVLHLAAERPPRSATAAYITLATNQWQHCCANMKSMTQFMVQRALPLLVAPPDLLICEDMGLLAPAAFTGRRPAATAGDAHKHLSAWAKAAGCATLCLLPQETPLDVRSSEYEQLRTFAWLRTVTVTPIEDGHMLDIGNGATLLPCRTLERFQRSVLITP